MRCWVACIRPAWPAPYRKQALSLFLETVRWISHESENQAHLPVMMNADLEFPMIVSARTAPSVLQKIWDHPVRDYYSYLEHLAVWIESLEWAYVPLEYENGFALVVAGKSQRGWITEFDRLLTLRHETVFELSRLNDRFHWTGPVQWG